MFASSGPPLSKSGEGRISGRAPGCSSGVPPGPGLTEHRLRLGARVALLLTGAKATEVALAHGLDGGVEPEDRALARAAALLAAAARVEQAGVVRRRAAEAVGLAEGEGLVAVVEGRKTRHRAVR